MAVTERNRAGSVRAIGTWGTAARLLVGGFLVGLVVYALFTDGGAFEPASWLLAFVGFPAALVTGQAWWARRHPGRLVAFTGPVGHPLTFAVFLILYGTTWYAPSLGFVSDAALLFFGASMLLAALRGYAGCEVLAISNWLLRRDDQVGCILFYPVDRIDAPSEHADGTS